MNGDLVACSSDGEKIYRMHYNLHINTTTKIMSKGGRETSEHAKANKTQTRQETGGKQN